MIQVEYNFFKKLNFRSKYAPGGQCIDPSDYLRTSADGLRGSDGHSVRFDHVHVTVRILFHDWWGPAA